MGKIKFNAYTFEVVEKIPNGYSVWNIPSIGNKEYVPLCERNAPQSKVDFSVNVDSLKIIKLPIKTACLLVKAGKEGVGSKDAAEKALASKRSKLKKAYAEATIDIFRRITEV